MKRSNVRFITLLGLCASFTTSAQHNWSDSGMPYPSFGIFQLYVDNVEDNLLACGLISTTNNFNANLVAIWDGSSWSNEGVFGGYLYTTARWGDTLIIGGSFSTVNDEPMRLLAAHYDGEWHPFGTFSEEATSVRKLRVLDGELYAVGSFIAADGDTCHGVAKRQGGAWVSVGGTIQYPPGNEAIVLDVAKYQGNLVIGGEMSPIGLGNDLLQFNGTAWSALGGGILGGFSAVGALEVYQGELYVGGDIYVGAGNAGHGLMRWNGTEWNDVGGSMRDIYGTTNYNASVLSMLVHDGELFVAGGFGYAGDLHANQFAIWDGTNWCITGDSIGHLVRTMAIYHDTLFLNCGAQLNGSPANFIARWVGGAFADVCSATNIVQHGPPAPSFSCNPVPFTDHLDVRMSDAHGRTIEVIDVQGRLVHSAAVRGSLRLGTALWTPGLYLVRLVDPGGHAGGSVRVIKE